METLKLPKHMGGPAGVCHTFLVLTQSTCRYCYRDGRRGPEHAAREGSEPAWTVLDVLGSAEWVEKRKTLRHGDYLTRARRALAPKLLRHIRDDHGVEVMFGRDE